MKTSLSKLRYALLLSILALTANHTRANHILGMDLNYTWVSGNTYSINLIAYGDCGNSAFPDLSTGVPTICIYNGSTYVTSITLTLQAPTSGTFTTPVCLNDTDSTTCTNISYTIPGIKKFVYSANYTVSGTSHNWRFVFLGDMLTAFAGRSTLITNILFTGFAASSVMDIEDTLDNTYHNNNSSPTLNALPNPYYCINTPNNYNPNGVDPDGDSLAYFLVDGKMGNYPTASCTVPGGTAPWTGTAWPGQPITATTPLQVATGSYSFSGTTGNIMFTPNAIQRSLVVYNIEEYRNDTFIGTSQRELSILVQSCTTSPPTGTITSSTGAGGIADSVDYTVCAGTGVYTFTITPTESDTSNNIYVSATGLPTGSTFTVTADSTHHPVATFSWTSTGVAAGTYTFYVTFSDNNCPVTGTKVVAFNVKVATSSTITGAGSVCVGSTLTLTGTPGGGTWTSVTTGVATVGSSSGVVTGVSAGTDVISYSIGTGCYSSATITVNASPGAISGTPHVCVGYSTTLTDPTGGGIWSSSNTGISTIGSTTGIVTGVTAGVDTIYYTHAGCSASLSFTVNANPAVITGASSVCNGTTTTLHDASPGGTWSSSNSAIATIGATTGIVTGVAVGCVTITYTVGSCYATFPLCVSVSPGPISGSPTVCIGFTTTYTDGTPGGTWTSSNPAVATVGSSTGIVTGVFAGTATISYTVGSCYAVKTITVNALPSGITGIPAVCVAQTTTLFDGGGGTWSSSNTAIATVGSSTGVVTGVSAGTVTITYTLSTGCYTTISVSVYSNPGPITGATSVCVGATTTLSDTTVGGFWSSSDPSTGLIDPATGVVTGVGAGTVTMTYTVSTGCFATYAMTVNPAPASITGTDSVCVGASASLFDGTLGGTWSSGSTAIATIGSTSGIYTGVSGGIAAITYTMPSGCYSIGFVTVNPLPAPISGPAALCIGQTAFMTDGTVGGSWSSSNPAVASIVSTSGLMTGITGGVTTITYTLPTGCYATKSVTINTSPGVISGPTTICVGSTASYTDLVGGGTWSSSNPAVATIGSATGIATGITVGTATLTYSIGGGCYSTFPITVNPLPAVIGGPTAVCVGATITATDGTGGGTWSTTSANITIGSTTGVITGVSAGTAVITYTAATTCFRTATITINPVPALFTVTGGGSYCAGGTGVLVGLSGSTIGVNYQLYNGASPVGTPVAGTGSAISFGLQTAAGTYTVRAVSPGTGCSSTMTGSATIVINPLPPLCAVTGGGAYCAGGAGVNVGLSCSSVGISYQLYVSGVPVGAPVTGTGLAISFGLQTTAGTYTVVATNTTTSCSRTMTGSAVVVVNPLPSPISGPSAVCAGATIILTDPGGGIWTSSTPAVATIGSLTGVVTGVTTGVDTITYTLPSGCKTSTTVTVSLSPCPIAGSTGVCMFATDTLTDCVPGGLWTSSNPAVASVGSLSGVVTGNLTGTATITYSLGSGCTRTITITVGTAPSPISGPSSVCIGSTIPLADPTPGGSWSSSSSAIASVSITGIVTGNAAGTATISYTAAGCAATKVITVNPTPVPIGGPSSVCVASTITLTDGTGGGVWSTTSSTASVGSSSGIVTGISSGTAVITYAIGTCIATKTITVNATAPITGTTGICVGATTTLSDAIPGGTWSSSNTAVATIGSTSGLLTGITGGTSVITYFIPGGCFVTTTVTVNGTPPVITGPSTLCDGSTAALTSTCVGGSGWSSSSPAIATIGSTSGIVTGISVGTVTITCFCVGCYSTLTMTVEPAPGPISGPSSVCQGQTITLTDATPGGSWSSSNPAVATVSGGIVSGVASGVATISYALTTGCAATITVTVHAAPGPITGTTKVCVGQTGTLLNSLPGGIWTSASLGVATVGSVTGIITGISPGTSLITYSSGGCATTITATVVPAPSPIIGVAPICVGSTLSLSDTVPGGVWTSSIPSIATVGSSTGVVTGVSSGTVIISYTSGTGCVKAAAIIVNPLAPILGTPVVCVGQTTHLIDTALGGIWSSSAPGTATVNSSGVVTGVAAGAATINYALPTGCTTSIVVTVNPLPSPISGPSSVCVGQSIGLTDTSPLGSWSSSAPGIGSVDPTGIVTGIAPGITVISYTFTGTTGCAATDTITVNPLPTPIAGPTAVCVGSNITLTDAITGGLWSSSNVALATVGSTSGIVHGVSSGIVTITYTAGTTCYVTQTVNVANPPPAPTGSPLSICEGQTTVLTDLAGPGTWSSSNPTVASVGSLTGIVTGGFVPGTAAITFSIGGGCFSPPLVVTVNPLPGAISGPANLCVGNTATFTDAFTGTGTWSSSDTTITTINASTGLATGIAPGVVIITFTTGAGCTSTIVLTVSASLLPITGSNTVCVGTSTPLADASPGGTWSSSAPAIGSVDPTGLVTGIAVGTTIISYSTGTPCPATMTMTVTPTPSAIGGSTNVCVGATTTLTNTVSGGTWSSSDVTVATVGSSSGLVTGISSGTVTIMYSLGASCSVTLNLTVNPLPSPITGPNNVCQYQAITLADATPGGTWSSSNPLIGSVDAFGNVTGVNGGTINISYANSFGCAATYPVTVNVAPAPITGSTNVCLGGTSTLHDAISGGTWTSTNTLVATVGSSSGIVSGISLGSATIIYQLAGSCFTTTVVNVYPLPTAFTVTGGGSHCAGDTGVHIGLTGSTIGVNYMLYRGTTAIGSFAGTGTPMSFGLVTVPGTYTVVGTSTATGCSITMFGSAVVTIIPSVVPGVTLNISPGDTVCAGTSVTFTPVATNGGTSPAYRWTVNSFPVSLGSTYTYIPANGDVVKVTLTSSAICAIPLSASDSVAMDVTPFVVPAVSIFAYPSDTVCKGSAVTINAIPAYGGHAPAYAWVKDGAPSGTGVSYTFIPNDGDVVYCVMNSDYPCRLANSDTSLPLTIKVDTARIPIVSILANPGTVIGPSQSDTLTAVVTDAVSPTYQWFLNGTPVSGATNAVFVHSGFSSPVDDSVSVAVTSHDVCHVTSHQWVYITVSSVGITQLQTGTADITVLPNPNKGEFYIKGNLGSFNDEDVSLEITDMIGQIVYKSSVTAKNGKLNEHVQLKGSLANGMYMLSVRSGTENRIFHIVVEQ